MTEEYNQYSFNDANYLFGRFVVICGGDKHMNDVGYRFSSVGARFPVSSDNELLFSDAERRHISSGIVAVCYHLL